MGLFLLAVTQGLGAQEIEGLWVYRSLGVETVFQFRSLASGEVVGQIVQRTGADAQTRYFCANPQFDGLPLLGQPWIRGLRPRGGGLWSEGLAVDTRNSEGNLFYCQARVGADGSSLVLESVAGLGAADRTLVLVPWTPLPPPEKSPPGNLLADLWSNPPEDPTRPVPSRPFLDRTADALVFGTFYYGTALVLVGLTLLALIRF